jgi:hypothetical protein
MLNPPPTAQREGKKRVEPEIGKIRYDKTDNILVGERRAREDEISYLIS